MSWKRVCPGQLAAAGRSRTIMSVRSRCHISQRGDFPTPAGLLAPSGECGEAGFDVQAGSAKRRSPLAGAMSDSPPMRCRVSSRPSRPASRATVVPWLKAVARPPTASWSDGIPTASPRQPIRRPWWPSSSRPHYSRVTPWPRGTYVKLPGTATIQTHANFNAR
jgi:hypothetical protein